MKYRHIDENPFYQEGVEVFTWAMLPAYDNDIWNDVETCRRHLENFRVPRWCWPDAYDNFVEATFEAIEEFNQTVPEEIDGREVVVYRSYDEPVGIWFCLYDPAIHTILEDK